MLPHTALGIKGPLLPLNRSSTVFPPRPCPAAVAASGSGGVAAEVPTVVGGGDRAVGAEAGDIPVLPDIARSKESKKELPLVCHIIGCGLSLADQAEY